jgi:hypothetical protein
MAAGENQMVLWGAFAAVGLVFVILYWGLGPYDDDPGLARSIGVDPAWFASSFEDSRFARLWRAIRGTD